MINKEYYTNIINDGISKISQHKEISIRFDVNDEVIELHRKIIEHFIKIKSIVLSIDLPDNYIIQFQNDMANTLTLFLLGIFNENDLNDPSIKTRFKESVESQKETFENQLAYLTFHFDFFNKINFSKNNIVAIGANGSGKTTLSNLLKRYLPANGIIISAQKILLIPTFSGISNLQNTTQKLGTVQKIDKTSKVTYSTERGGSYQVLQQIGSEFEILLDNLLAERSSVRNEYFNRLKNKENNIDLPETKLDLAFKIWNSLIEHRIIGCDDGININLKASGIEKYHAFQMSDGEKVLLYHITQVLQAPTDGFIIIDEPEMYLHKTILNKLWDTLERERQDCIFVYLTHDLDFAKSRVDTKIIWIRSFTFPSTWDIESIPENEMPEALLLELLGSRKNILFCEGKKGSIDEKIYNILFSQYTITPVDGCSNVINYTKAFNKIKSIGVKAYGLIDSDYHTSDRINSLITDNIFSFSVTESENLFFDEEFLKIFSKQFMKEEDTIESIKKDVIKQMEDEIELQVSNYISAKVNHYFKNSHISKGNTLEKVLENHAKFTEEIKINEWYTERKNELERIIEQQNYTRILSIFNNKGLKRIAERHLSISEFTDRAIKFIQRDPLTHEILLKYFPEALKSTE